METRLPGHCTEVPAASSTALPSRGQPAGSTVASDDPRTDASETPVFEDVYAEHFAFVWRSVRRLGVDPASVDDVVQETFLVVHRRLADYEARGSIKTWLFGIVVRAVRHRRRTLRRKPAQLGGPAILDPLVDEVSDSSARTPHECAAEREAVRTLHALLDELADEKREVFILAELEQLTVPEIAEAVFANVNTVYSRLRAARKEFDEAVARHRARDEWRTR
ncbi:MAG TPA: RNA polymerase sigma factor [Polyangiaceae bacterium]|jgi:RNA polymerase sigma-70 factor (ECF subfamily)